ncbi:MAG: 2-oxoglutarate dehydrogenase complex dihydrolipoyllysine-residue succinyltransferase [Spirochaetia bacterium]|nr:2-oxoglutarate dehydrogenase complex dihydrolipoyllysine-residue succinyltransferase [Spirochaetia bacterium]
MREILVPNLGESITEGTIASWFKKEGEPVSADEPLVELETDKVTVEINSPAEGILEKINKTAGENVSVNEVIGIVKTGVSAQSKPKDDLSTSPKSKKEEIKSEETLISPAARRLAEENSIDISKITGTGKHDQISKEDVILFLDKIKKPPNENKPDMNKSSDFTATSENTNKNEEIIPMSRLRQAIAQRLVQVQQTSAILTTFNEIDMSAVMNLRAKYKDAFEKKYGIKLGFMSFFVKAVIYALKEFPAINAEIRNNNIVYKKYYNIGVAVGGPKGLVVPVLKNAEKLSFADIEKEISRLALKVKDSAISLSELEGGTFSITNGGIYGSMLSTPILNPPQSAILGMHNIVQRPVVIHNEIVIRPVMYVALSYDHRIVDGKEAVTFLLRIKEAVEEPARLMLEA